MAATGGKRKLATVFLSPFPDEQTRNLGDNEKDACDDKEHERSR